MRPKTGPSPLSCRRSAIRRGRSCKRWRRRPWKRCAQARRGSASSPRTAAASTGRRLPVNGRRTGAGALLRLLESLARFASAAYQATEYLNMLEQRRAALNLLEDAVQAQALVEESNRKLRKSEEELLESDRRKNEFLALLGHELRNPLSPISTASELLSRTVAGEPRARFAIGMIKRQTAQLTRLVDDLLDIGRITQGRIQLRRKPIDLARVIAQAIETIEPQLRERKHTLSVMASTSDGPLYVNGDLARLVQCVGNILANAAKYTEGGG